MNLLELATLGGGCFWCTEAVFDNLAGVQEVVSGYCGGHVNEPRYEQICNGDTGHAEVVQILFDPELISYRELLAVFFAIHDPTTLNRQGHDVGSQYRSAIFTHDAAQDVIARETVAALTIAGAFPQPIVTEIVAASTFWPAEDYHQEYFAQHQRQPYCQSVVAPKLAKFRASFRQKLKQN